MTINKHDIVFIVITTFSFIMSLVAPYPINYILLGCVFLVLFNRLVLCPYVEQTYKKAVNDRLNLQVGLYKDIEENITELLETKSHEMSEEEIKYIKLVKEEYEKEIEKIEKGK